MPLSIKYQQIDKNTVKLTLAGQINSETSDNLDREIETWISKKISTVILDIAGVDFVSSAGIGVIIKSKMSLLRFYGNLAIVNPQPQITKVFNIMKLLPAMNVFANVAELDDYLMKIQKRMVEGEQIYE